MKRRVAAELYRSLKLNRVLRLSRVERATEATGRRLELLDLLDVTVNSITDQPTDRTQNLEKLF